VDPSSASPVVHSSRTCVACEPVRGVRSNEGGTRCLIIVREKTLLCVKNLVISMWMRQKHGVEMMDSVANQKRHDDSFADFLRA
jgi:hypothetical protein